MGNSMANLFLIAHKVRGEPAFDVATQIMCAECQGNSDCPECDGTGFWWIIPTSGHRAYPYWHSTINEDWIGRAPDMPDDLPDHYTTRAAPKTERIDMILALLPKAPAGPPIKRRF